jgi:hypothetical protein
MVAATLNYLGTAAVWLVGLLLFFIYARVLINSVLIPFIKERVRKIIVQRFADGGITVGKDIVVYDDRAFWIWATNGSLGFGETYMEHMWDVKGITLDELCTKMARLPAEKKRKFKPWNSKFKVLSFQLFNQQTLKKSHEVVKKHYNLGNDFYEQWLDKNMQYSCAYWKGATDLEEAQINKMHLLAEKLKLKPG